MSLFRKWLYGEAQRGSMSAWTCDRGATKPDSHFRNNPSGGGSFAASLCCSSVKDRCGYSPSSRRGLRQNPSPRHLQVFKTLCLDCPAGLFPLPHTQWSLSAAAAPAGLSPPKKSRQFKRARRKNQACEWCAEATKIPRTRSKNWMAWAR